MVGFTLKLFDALHSIILGFFNRVGVFFPALANGLLVGRAAYEKVYIWTGDVTVAWTMAIIAGGALEAAGIGMSWNMRFRTRNDWAKVSVYVIGSWILIWFGLHKDLLLAVVGSIMPVFAVILQATIADREMKEREVEVKRETKKTEMEIKLALAREATKQVQAEARVAKAQNLGQRVTKSEVAEFIHDNPEMSITDMAKKLGVSRQTIYNHRSNNGLRNIQDN